ncbi:MAG: sortase [Firmicutes bacterium]|nr:sortase [Bacillota bacterium]
MSIKLSAWLIMIGLLAFLLAGGLWLYNLRAENMAADYSLDQARLLLEDIRQGKYLDGSYIGVLSIPDLQLDLPVRREWSYPDLKLTPCRYAGAVEDNTLVIAAHNFKKHFGNISALKIGSPIKFTALNGSKYTYQVAKIETVRPTAVTEVVNSDYDLTLFTCTYGGKTRIVVRCMRA